MDHNASWSRRVAVAVVIGAAVLTPASALAAPGRTGPAAGATPAAGSVPASFKAASITWLNLKRGWVLGAVPCGAKFCWFAAGTADGARTWRMLGRVGPATGAPPDVRPAAAEIRFATARVGWAFGPGLFRTTNGGWSWRAAPIPGGGKQVLDLAISSAGVYAVVSPCDPDASGCTKPLSLWRTGSPISACWHRVPLKLPLAPSASMSAFGRTVYVIAMDIAKAKGSLFASTGGRRFSARPSPCDISKDLGLIQAVATSPKRVALLCVGNPGFSKADKTVYVSNNTGITDRFAGMAGPYGILAELAASRSGALAVAAWSSGSFIYLGGGPQLVWPMVLGLSDDGVGFNDLAYVSSKVAWAVHGPVSVLADNPGDLCVTRDGGSHWSLVKI